MNNVLKLGLSLLALAIVVGFFGTFYTLEEGEQAVIVEFGRPVGAPVTAAGLHIKVPFIQEVRRFEKRILIWDGDPNQIPDQRARIHLDRHHSPLAHRRRAEVPRERRHRGRRALTPERHHRLGGARSGVRQ